VRIYSQPDEAALKRAAAVLEGRWLVQQAGARLEQIQLSLGHQSIQTTQRYVGVELDLQDAPCHHLGLRMPG
jgi:integrase